MSASDDQGDRSPEIQSVTRTDERDSHAPARTLNRTERAIALMEQGYSQAAAAAMSGLSVGALRMGRRRRGLGPLEGGSPTGVTVDQVEEAPRPPRIMRIVEDEPAPVPTGRRVLRAAAPVVDIDDPEVCTDDRCTLIELHRRGPHCRMHGGVRIGAGRRLA